MAIATKPRAEQWASKICTQMGKSVESIIEVGRLLIKAKADLPHGEWSRMFQKNLVPFGQSSADKLMKIANNHLLSNSEYVPNLPPSWRTLYELSKADPAKLKNALKDGVITADMKGGDVKALLPPKNSNGHRSKAAVEFDVTVAVALVINDLQDALDKVHVPASARDEFNHELTKGIEAWLRKL